MRNFFKIQRRISRGRGKPAVYMLKISSICAAVSTLQRLVTDTQTDTGPQLIALVHRRAVKHVSRPQSHTPRS